MQRDRRTWRKYNILAHERINTSSSINGCSIRVELETRDHEHISAIRSALTEGGYNVMN